MNIGIETNVNQSKWLNHIRRVWRNSQDKKLEELKW